MQQDKHAPDILAAEPEEVGVAIMSGTEGQMHHVEDMMIVRADGCEPITSMKTRLISR